MSVHPRHWLAFATFAASVLLLVRASAQDQGQVRELTIVGDHYAYAPNSLTVNKNDLVKVTFTAQDQPHSFTMEGYRIAKRANAGQTITFEFRADQAGSFTFYCALSQDARCKDMKGTLTVR